MYRAANGCLTTNKLLMTCDFFCSFIFYSLERSKESIGRFDTSNMLRADDMLSIYYFSQKVKSNMISTRLIKMLLHLTVYHKTIVTDYSGRYEFNQHTNKYTK